MYLQEAGSGDRIPTRTHTWESGRHTCDRGGFGVNEGSGSRDLGGMYGIMYGITRDGTEFD